MNRLWNRDEYVPYVPMSHVARPGFKVSLDSKCYEIYETDKCESDEHYQRFVEKRAQSRFAAVSQRGKSKSPFLRSKDKSWLMRLIELDYLTRKTQKKLKPTFARTASNNLAMIAFNPNSDFNTALFANDRYTLPDCFTQSRGAYNTVSSIDTPRDIEFKFYTNPLMFKVISVIKAAEVKELKPFNGAVFDFSVKLSYLRTIDGNLISTNGTRCAIILRIAPYCPNQFNFVDMVPNSIRITINGRPVSGGNSDPLESAEQELEYTGAPLELTNYCYPNNQIRLMSQAKQNLRIVIGVYFVQLTGIEESLNIFNRNSMCREINAEHSTVQRMIAANGGKILVTLKCPLSNQRLEIPCVGDCCDHVECFDLSSFLKSEKNPFLWKCPICNLVMKFIAKDVMMSNVLQNVSAACNEIMFYGSGEWREIIESQIEEIVVIDLTDDNSEKSFEQSSIIEDMFIERV